MPVCEIAIFARIFSPLAISLIFVICPISITAWAFLSKVQPEAKVPRHPNLSHQQGWPLTSSLLLCPNAPANPLSPSYNFPFQKKDPPKPVARVTNAKFSCPFPEPQVASPSAASIVSVATKIGISYRSCNNLVSGKSYQCRFGETTISPVSLSTRPHKLSQTPVIVPYVFPALSNFESMIEKIISTLALPLEKGTGSF